MKLMEGIMKLVEGNKENKYNKILYGLEDLNQEQLYQLQEIIDNWTEDALRKRREMRKRAKEMKGVIPLTKSGYTLIRD